MEFRDVSFSYGVGGDPVLQGISFVAEPGQTVAILGATGSGKSSLVHLVSRFYDVTSGRVLLDGVDVREIPEAELRKRVVVALQESILFSTTIRGNIAFGDPDAKFERIVEAAKWAEADGFIRGLPEGYETVVGQRGVTLSGGQKQRLAIARAVLLGSPVLIFDDSTSAVDLRTEAKIQRALNARRVPHTRIIVAQRISAVRNADRIIVLEEGDMVGSGSHRELLVDCPIYREIHESQSENEVLVHGGE